jgi:hypothetical protein
MFARPTSKIDNENVKRTEKAFFEIFENYRVIIFKKLAKRFLCYFC